MVRLEPSVQITYMHCRFCENCKIMCYMYDLILLYMILWFDIFNVMFSCLMGVFVYKVNFLFNFGISETDNSN